jgi:hypothetical protein
VSEEPPTSRIRSLVGLVLVVALFAAVWFVMSELRKSSALQDCYASGRTNCVTIDSSGAHTTR